MSHHLCINSECIAGHHQLSPISPVNLFSSPYTLNKPTWCVKPRHMAILEDIMNGQTYALGMEPFHTIGRNEKSTIVIENLLVSRCHAALLHHTSGEFYLIDLSSAHGTYIGHSRLEPYVPTIVRKGSIMRYAYQIFNVSHKLILVLDLEVRTHRNISYEPTQK